MSLKLANLSLKLTYLILELTQVSLNLAYLRFKLEEKSYESAILSLEQDHFCFNSMTFFTPQNTPQLPLRPSHLLACLP